MNTNNVNINLALFCYPYAEKVTKCLSAILVGNNTGQV